MIGNHKAVVIIGLTLSLLYACTPAQTSDLSVPRWEILIQGSQCGSPDADARWLQDRDALQAVWVNRTTLGGSPKSSPPSLPNHWMLYLASGQKPTSGYHIIVNDVHRIDSDTLQLVIDWMTPAKGKMTAQMLTKPCVILALEKDSYSAVEFTNWAGTTVTIHTPKKTENKELSSEK